MSKLTKAQKIEKRQAYSETLDRLFSEYSKILIVKADNIRSLQIAQIRKMLRGKAELLFGKKTLIERFLKLQKNEDLKVLIPYIKLNIGLIFTNGDYKPILQAFEDTKRKAGAKSGMLAPSEVIIQPMLTQMGPDQHSFFVSLGVDTKINKGKIEIVNPVHLIKKGDTVSPSHATLLQKLEIEPFFYRMEVDYVYDKGQIFDSSILEVDDEVMNAKFQLGLSYFTSIALGANIPVLPAVPHIFMESFKMLIGVGVECEMSGIPQVAKMIEMFKNPSAFAVAAAPVAQAAAVEEKKEKSEEEEVIGGFMMDSSSSDESESD